MLASDAQVLWVEGVGVSAICAVQDKTSRILFIEISENDTADGESL